MGAPALPSRDVPSDKGTILRIFTCSDGSMVLRPVGADATITAGGAGVVRTAQGWRSRAGGNRWWFLAALLAVTIAVASDFATDEHTTHTAGLILAASVAAMVHWCLKRGSDGLALALTCAVATQPVVHLMTKLGDYDFAHDRDGLTQLAGDGPTTMMEIVAAVIVILVVNAAGRLTATQLARIAYSVLLLLGIEPTRQEAHTEAVRPVRLGSMRRWCGWVLQAARRGPPAPSPA